MLLQNETSYGSNQARTHLGRRTPQRRRPSSPVNRQSEPSHRSGKVQPSVRANGSDDLAVDNLLKFPTSVLWKLSSCPGSGPHPTRGPPHTCTWKKAENGPRHQSPILRLSSRRGKVPPGSSQDCTGMPHEHRRQPFTIGAKTFSSGLQQSCDPHARARLHAPETAAALEACSTEHEPVKRKYSPSSRQ